MIYTLISGNPLAVERNLNKLAKEQPDHKVVTMSSAGGSTSVLVTTAKKFDIINNRVAAKENREARIQQAKIVTLKARQASIDLEKKKLDVESAKLKKSEGGV